MGGHKSFMAKTFNCKAHPTKVFMNTPLYTKYLFPDLLVQIEYLL